MFNQLRGYMAALLLAGGLTVPIAATWTQSVSSSQSAAQSCANSPSSPAASSTSTATPATSQTAATPPAQGLSVSFLPDATSEIVVPLVTVNEGKTCEATASILLRNDGSANVKVSNFRAILRNEAGKLYQPEVKFHLESGKDSVEINARDIAKIKISAEIAGPSEAFGIDPDRLSLSLVGYLMATAERAPSAEPNTLPTAATGPGKQTAATGKGRQPKGQSQPAIPPPVPIPPTLLLRPLRLTPPVPSSLAGLPVLAGLAVGFLIVLASYISLGNSRRGLSDEMGLPAWDGSSWATNLTAVAAVITALLTNLITVQTQRLQRSEYNALVILFGALVTLAPALYNSIRRSTESGTAGQPPTYKGYVGMFLAVTVITLWAVFGEIITLVILIDEAGIARITAFAVTRAFQGTLVVAVILLIAYSVRAIRSNAMKAPKHDKRAVVAVAEQPLPRWHVL